MTSRLIDAVLEQIVRDVESGDLTAIEELVSEIDTKRLRHFLSEDALAELENG